MKSLLILISGLAFSIGTVLQSTMIKTGLYMLAFVILYTSFDLKGEK